MRKIGNVIYNSQKGWFLVRIGDETSLEVYFMHWRDIRSGLKCTVGSKVSFEAAPPRNPGQRSLAINCDIIDVIVTPVVPHTEVIS
jgi:hypothetical protein